MPAETPPDLNRSVKHQFREAIDLANINQIQLAELLEICPETLCRWLAKEGKDLSLSNIAAIASHLGKSVEVRLEDL